MIKYGPHLTHFKKKWGFDYQCIYRDYENIKNCYSGTIIGRYLDHNPFDGPITKFDIEQNEDEKA